MKVAVTAQITARLSVEEASRQDLRDLHQLLTSGSCVLGCDNQELREHLAREIEACLDKMEPAGLLNCGECSADKLIAANRKLEAQAKTPQGVLRWRPTPGSNSPLIAESRGTGTSPYYLISVLRDGVQKWTVRRECVELYVGTANECMAWCESIEAELPTTTG